MPNSIAKIVHLSHRYARDWAIWDISFDITEKGVMGLLGANGAGKSTTMNILCGVINQTEGNVFIDGVDMRKNPVEAKRLIGFLPQKAPLHLELTVDEYLTHCAYMRSVPKGEIYKAVEEAKEKCGIGHFSKRLLVNLSGGYQQRVGIAQAIIHRPKLVVLDEPTNGLDPNQILEVRKLIGEIARERSVILSTHILSEVQATCHDIVMMAHGRVVFADTLQAFNNYITPNSLVMHMLAAPDRDVLMALPFVQQVEQLDGQRWRLFFNDDKGITERLIQMSVENGWQLVEIYLEKSSLDGVFAQLSKKQS
ncbi:ABC transporter ATP-binding protein [Olivibacter sitiensis]|uniref:ABC transporter ATP-binding protein n=1 Tax=Olivibacter sitiensis TaxID=376470 RepID=UPI00040F81F7|nr:ATP-binding cassette domain-containing protein [Olivibacter sitiensis]